jgi:hypothetical protein
LSAAQSHRYSPLYKFCELLVSIQLVSGGVQSLGYPITGGVFLLSDYENYNRGVSTVHLLYLHLQCLQPARCIVFYPWTDFNFGGLSSEIGIAFESYLCTWKVHG